MTRKNLPFFLPAFLVILLVSSAHGQNFVTIPSQPPLKPFGVIVLGYLELKPDIPSSQKAPLQKQTLPSPVAPDPTPFYGYSSQTLNNSGVIKGTSCAASMQRLGYDIERLPPFGDAKGCGINNGVLLKSVDGIDIKPDAKLDCAYALRFANWVRGDLSNIVFAATNSKLSTIENMSSYRCTNRAKGKRSLHASGKAFDLGGMTTQNGMHFSVLKDWGEHLDRSRTAPMINGGARQKKRPAFKPNHQLDPVSLAKREVWMIVADNACTNFQLVLTPHSNKDHANHLHLDQGNWKQCEL